MSLLGAFEGFAKAGLAIADQSLADRSEALRDQRIADLQRQADIRKNAMTMRRDEKNREQDRLDQEAQNEFQLERDAAAVQAAKEQEAARAANVRKQSETDNINALARDRINRADLALAERNRPAGILNVANPDGSTTPTAYYNDGTSGTLKDRESGEPVRNAPSTDLTAREKEMLKIYADQSKSAEDQIEDLTEKMDDVATTSDKRIAYQKQIDGLRANIRKWTRLREQIVSPAEPAAEGGAEAGEINDPDAPKAAPETEETPEGSQDSPGSAQSQEGYSVTTEDLDAHFNQALNSREEAQRERDERAALAQVEGAEREQLFETVRDAASRAAEILKNGSADGINDAKLWAMENNEILFELSQDGKLYIGDVKRLNKAIDELNKENRGKPGWARLRRLDEKDAGSPEDDLGNF